MNGVLIVDKPAKFTSFDVVAVIRGVFQTKKVGHTGTLDPMATGVLPILLGSATKAQSLMPDSSKQYEAEFVFGVSTDTLDISGRVLKKEQTFKTYKDILGVLDKFKGSIMQIPPMYSAVSYDGHRLYDLARQGIEVERKERPVFIEKLELLDFEEGKQTGHLLVRCSKGTYIRTLIYDIGRALGVPAVMSKLRRTVACGYNIDKAISLDELRNMKKKFGIESVSALVRPVETIFEPYRAIFVTAAQAKRFRNGGGLALKRTSLASSGQHADGEIFRIYDNSNMFLGLAYVNVKRGELSFLKLFQD